MASSKKEGGLEVSETTKKRYFRSLVQQIHSLRLAMEKSDLETVREICHRVRGSANLFGLGDLGEACKTMEEASLAKRLVEIVQNFQVIEVIVSRHAGPMEA
jgi:HPt (histidine-containing phosphotransfer) domain-containing protein